MIKWASHYAPPKVLITKIFIVVIILSTLSMGSAFAQSNNPSYDAHRSVNNAIALPHVEAVRHEQPRVKINKANAIFFLEADEHERAIITHSFMNNSTSYAHQKMIERCKKRLNKSETNIAFSSLSGLNVGDKTTLVHERVSSAGAEAHRIQARNLCGLCENKE